MTQLNTLLNGGSALVAVIFAFFSVILTLIWYKRTKNQTFITGIFMTLAIGFGWMGITISFLSILLTGSNLPYYYLYIRFFSYSTLPIGCVAIMSVGWDMFMPSKKYKKTMLIIMIIISVFYYIVLYWDIYAVTEVSNTGGSELIDDWLIPMTIPYFIFLGMTGVTSGMLGILFFNFFKKTSGEIRKRAILVVFGAVFLGSAVLMDTVIFMGDMWKDFLFIPRIQVTIGGICILLGFKPA